MDLDEILSIGFGIFLGVTIANILHTLHDKENAEVAVLYNKPEHILTSRGRMLLVEVGEESNVVSIVKE